MLRSFAEDVTNFPWNPFCIDCGSPSVDWVLVTIVVQEERQEKLEVHRPVQDDKSLPKLEERDVFPAPQQWRNANVAEG